APCSRVGSISNADPQPLYVRLRHASRRRHHGRARVERGEGHSRRRDSLMAGARERVVIIGAGHNGLVAAFYLAKAGFAPLVLERRGIAGGAAVTEEIHPGFLCPTLAHAAGPLLPQIWNDVQLEKQGLQIIKPEARVVALHPDGRAMRIYDDPQRTAAELAPVSAHDAGNYPKFHSSFGQL